MRHPDLAVVTGAFGYTGRYVARRLIDQGVRVRTLTRRPAGRNPLGGLVETVPLDFSDPDGLRRSMQGAGVLYNTYWMRYAHGQMTFDHVVENTRTLFEAAERAGVSRIVHFSVTNASIGSELPYFRGKGQVEAMLKGLGINYAILRPTLVFGDGDLLLNNMAWALRRFPVFPVYGKGDYPVQPVYVEDVAFRLWRPVPRVRTSSLTRRGRIHSLSRSCFACWPPLWASVGGWYTRRLRWASP